MRNITTADGDDGSTGAEVSAIYHRHEVAQLKFQQEKPQVQDRNYLHRTTISAVGLWKMVVRDHFALPVESTKRHNNVHANAHEYMVSVSDQKACEMPKIVCFLLLFWDFLSQFIVYLY